MLRAKNYETMSTFVKVMQKKLWPLFSGHGVYTAAAWVEKKLPYHQMRPVLNDGGSGSTSYDPTQANEG